MLYYTVKVNLICIIGLLFCKIERVKEKEGLKGLVFLLNFMVKFNTSKSIIISSYVINLLQLYQNSLSIPHGYMV